MKESVFLIRYNFEKFNCGDIKKYEIRIILMTLIHLHNRR